MALSQPLIFNDGPWACSNYLKRLSFKKNHFTSVKSVLVKMHSTITIL